MGVGTLHANGSSNSVSNPFSVNVNVAAIGTACRVMPRFGYL
jgi:hypothetical protein